MKDRQGMIPDFGYRLKLARTQAKMLAKQVYESLDISKTTYSNWESGTHMPGHSTVVKLAKKFNVSVDYLYGIETNQAVSTHDLRGDQIDTLKIVAEQFRKDNDRAKDR